MNFIQRPILVVAEAFPVRERLYELLHSQGFAVITAHSVERATLALRRDRPGIVVMLIDTPEASDGQFIEHIRSFDRTLPIVILSPHPDVVTAHLATYGHVQAVLPHDLPDGALVSQVARWVQLDAKVPGPRGTGSVLVVDDEPAMREMLRTYFTRLGFTVTAVESGEEACDYAELQPVDLVLLDVQLPRMDGLLALRRIKARQPHAVVIMMTGFEDQTLMVQAFALGAYEYLMKPLDFSYLESVLSTRPLAMHLSPRAAGVSAELKAD